MTEQHRIEQQEQQPVYFIVFAILAIFTVFEIGTSYLTDLPQVIKIGLLVFLAAVKVGLVLAYFMHLRFDNRIFVLPVALGVVLIVPLLLIVTLTTRPASDGSSNQNQGATASSSGSQTLNVTEESYNISLSTNTLQAGNVTFHVTNAASQMPHELLIIKTDQAPD
ncbi:MAG: cytochrome C oxidase subunit IV family protein, partial [Anaerolineae bacterium]|nr:cytochrome C oxidase subunit IV family protein [Anaerolineae bacterium]